MTKDKKTNESEERLLPPEADPRHFVIIKNAHQNNLKNLDLNIKHGQFVVVTGVSGSGKSSLAFDTLYEEGRRRYVESLSAYVRQFLGKIQKPKIDYIKGLPPAIAIEQKRSTASTRSTVGTITEINHYLKLLYARAGRIYSPVSGVEVKRQDADDVVDFIMSKTKGSQIRILARLDKNADRSWTEEFGVLLQKGFTRVLCTGEEHEVEDILQTIEKGKTGKQCLSDDKVFVLIDRLVVDDEEKDQSNRVADSVQTAFQEGAGKCYVKLNHETEVLFSNRLEADGLLFEEPTPDLFSFNSPYGACPECNGYGETLGIDEDKVIPNKNLNLYNGAVICWETEKMIAWKKDFISRSAAFDFPLFTPYNQLTEAQKDLLWEGNKKVDGINAYFKHLEENTYKVHYRIMLSRYRGRSKCRICKGSRLRKEANYVKIDGKSIGDLLNIPVLDLKEVFDAYTKNNPENKIAARLLKEINVRLKMMVDIGLGYLTLNRSSRTLSGGELQRIQLIHSLGSNLTGSLYILDEPSIGLHPRDTRQLIRILQELKEMGNTVVVVEHDEEIIRAADEIIDLGPNAGRDGGYLIFQGSHQHARELREGLTAQYLLGVLSIPDRTRKTEFAKWIHFKGSSKHNLKNIDVDIPLNAMTVVSGVSGSGKTTLVKEVIYESLMTKYNGGLEAVNCTSVEGNVNSFSSIEFVSQDSIERSRRSNAVTYLKIFDAIREIFSNQPLAKMNAYTPAYFSFNVEGGRCEECKGDGMIMVEMQFVADMHLICEECKGKRFKDEVLEVLYQEKNIFDVLSMTVTEAYEFFKDHKAIQQGLMPLIKVGLDYLQLGQSTSTLSGGEAQRLKLASFLGKGGKSTETVFFIFDEPTTGLHWHDINKLLQSFDELLLQGHTLLIIEHNPEIIRNADYVIDLGKEGGELGGNVVFQGITEKLIEAKDSYTAEFIRNKLIKK